jgi:hypothetical protein
MSDRDTRLSQGFSAGNYCNSYETQDYDQAVKIRDLEGSGPEFKTAFTMGFFASYELHEIPSTWRDAFDEAYHSELGQRVLELGYTDPRTEDYANESDDARDTA